MKLARCFAAIFTAIMLVSCKIRIIVPEGGKVETSSGAHHCASGKTCDIDVVDFFFDDTFIAKPASGYKFKFWKKGPGRLCGWNREPCHIYTTGFDENIELAEVIQSFLESNEVFYLHPVFVEVNRCTDDVPGTRNEFTLRQGESTTREVPIPRIEKGNLSWRFEVCPEGVCSDSWHFGGNPPFMELIFSTKTDTPLGIYKIQYIFYRGGTHCVPIFGCLSTKERIKKRYNFILKVAECPS